MNPDDETIINDNRENGMFIMVKDAIVTEYDKAYNKLVDAVISSSVVVLEFPISVEDTVVPDAIRSQVASVRSVYDPGMFVNKLNDLTSESKFAAAVGIMDANPQYCDIFSGDPQDMYVSTTNSKIINPCRI